LHLQDKPSHITILVRSPAKADEFNKLHSRLHAVAGDLSDANKVATLAENADFVIHCVSLFFIHSTPRSSPPGRRRRLAGDTSHLERSQKKTRDDWKVSRAHTHRKRVLFRHSIAVSPPLRDKSGTGQYHPHPI
jgi:hypothetical protein